MGTLSTLSEAELEEIRQAQAILENPGFALRLQSMLGQPIEQGLKRLPEKWRDGINKATDLALRRALDVAAATMPEDCQEKPPANVLHKLLAASSGAVGGAVGLPGLAVELPISTVIMLRSIMDVARSEGEAIQSVEAKLACMEVFALGGPGSADDAAEIGYYAVRAVLSQQISELARQTMQRGLSDASAPAVMRFIASISSRFGIVVSQKAMATAVPLIGAAGGAMVNALFIDHFQNVARAHFTIRRLERTHGVEIVRQEYQKLIG